MRDLDRPDARDDRVGAARGDAAAPVIVLDDSVDDQSIASFPASDPPGWWAGR